MFDRLFNQPALYALERAMDASAVRAELIANNIANADTPNYKAVRMRFEEYLEREMGISTPTGDLPLQRTDSRHLPGNVSYGINGQFINGAFVYIDDSTTFRLDGNNVDIDHETAEQAKNAIQYSTLTELAGRRLSALRTVISEGRR
ncbi:MAG TPA: flagellar basal body rod protein FlgB [bacterium]|jgi:flagellar basal-body rod protein FlgB